MVIIRNIANPFKTEEAQIRKVKYSRSKCVRDYLDAVGFDYHDKRVIVTGKRIDDLSVRIDDGDEITVIPEVKAPVIAVVSWIISAVWAAAVAHPFLFAFFVLSMGYSIYQYMNQPRIAGFQFGVVEWIGRRVADIRLGRHSDHSGGRGSGRCGLRQASDWRKYHQSVFVGGRG